MKYLLLIVCLSVYLFSLTKECEVATVEATIIHMQYVDGNLTLTDSYNARNRMKKICKDKE